MGGFRGFGQVFWPLAWLRPVADTEAASRTREKKTLAQSNLHVYIRTEWRKLLDCIGMLCRPAFYPYKPLQFCKHAKSFQHPWNVSLFKNSAELSSPVSFTALIIWIEIRSSEVRLFHQRDVHWRVNAPVIWVIPERGREGSSDLNWGWCVYKDPWRRSCRFLRWFTRNQCFYILKHLRI